MSRFTAFVGLAALLFGLAGLPASSEETSQEMSEELSEEEIRKRKLAVRVMQVTGATAKGDEVAYGLLAQLRPGYPSVPDEVWGELRGSFALEEIIELSIPIYARNFDEDELKQLVEFYESPIGRKMIERMPVVMQESTQAFNTWNIAKYGEVMHKLQEKGYEPVPEFGSALRELGVNVPAPK